MEYNLISRHEECAKLLNTCDIVGVAYKDILIGPHFHGNFWWSKVSYFKKLPEKIGDNYTDPEAYVFKGPSPKVCKMDGATIPNATFLYTSPHYTKLYIDLPDSPPQKGGGSSNISNKTCDIVISRFQEELQWLDDYKTRGFHEVYIYNKSGKPIKCPLAKCHIKSIPNTGVCDNTYLYHIVHHYDKLADITIFAPGSANSDHKREMLDFTINMALNKKDTVLNTYTFDVSAKEAMYNFTMTHYPIHTKNNHEGDDNFEHSPASIRPFGAWYQANFPGVEIKQASFFGIFAASKKHIHQRPKTFYEKLLKQINTHKFHEASHYIERSWPAILNAPEECMHYSKIFDERIDKDHGGFRSLRRKK